MRKIVDNYKIVMQNLGKVLKYPHKNSVFYYLLFFYVDKASRHAY